MEPEDIDNYLNEDGVVAPLDLTTGNENLNYSSAMTNVAASSGINAPTGPMAIISEDGHTLDQQLYTGSNLSSPPSSSKTALQL